MSKRMGVIGAGTMGHGIAELAAVSGYRVKLYDVNTQAVQKGLDQIRWSLEKLSHKGILTPAIAQAAAGQIETTTVLAEAAKDVDFVVEAAPENLALKREIFATLDAAASSKAVLGTNTSSLPITQIASATAHPERVIGLHFFNPPMLMTLIEIVQGEKTAQATVQAAVELAKSLNKVPVVCRKDVRGFITSRTFEGFIGEAMWLLSRGEATVKAVDARMKAEGFPMGPFELADLTGLDIGYNVRREAGEPNPPVLEEKVKAGELGRKSGRGFYHYAAGKGADYAPQDAAGFDPLPLYAVMANITADLVAQEVAPPEDIDLAMRLGGGFPMGPLAKADAIGLDVIVRHLEQTHAKHRQARYLPCPLLKDKVSKGERGQAAGVGFYRY